MTDMVRDEYGFRVLCSIGSISNGWNYSSCRGRLQGSCFALVDAGIDMVAHFLEAASHWLSRAIYRNAGHALAKTEAKFKLFVDKPLSQ